MEFAYNIVKHIDENFCFINYANIEVIMLKYNGYINATKICNLGNKNFRHWCKLESSKKLIKTLNYKNGIYNKTVLEIGLISNSVYKYDLVGTYVHIDLVPHIICWVFPSIALNFSKILNSYLSNSFCMSLRKDPEGISKILYDIHDNEILNLKKNSKKLEEKYEKSNSLIKQKLSDLEVAIKGLSIK
ncbi:N1R/p28 family protein [Pigeonpox virus]|uniref:N1R/p28 family protein n=1 Tax=Pigeonpox virus TaxID=10264 RepID=A0A068EG44_9POXV|nr:N1R/p28 family protein [Pigeonpox virus]AID46585.1 N1R/p28 family protein [Pigeonpox virus]